MRAAIAVRVSPRPQEQVRYSPEIQVQKCSLWAEENGHEVVTIVQDILVSGGASDRFDSIFDAIEEHHPDMFVVSDLSRWTRDKPSRFWVIKAMLEDRGIRLVSVDEPWLADEDRPFSATLATAQVEMNWQERQRIKSKTSTGVRKAWASGKRWGHPFGWTWHPRDDHPHGGEACLLRGVWTQDVERITAFYLDWIAGTSGYVMAHRYGMAETNVRQAIGARSQRDIVGAEMWDRAQLAERPRGVRRDTGRSSIYRGLLVCPFCGGTLQHTTHWGHYKCHRHHLTTHGWWSLSARRYVTPEVRRVLGHLTAPEPAPEAAKSNSQGTPRDWEGESERLTMAWVKGRLAEDAYEKALAEIEQDRLRYMRTVETSTPQVEEWVRELGIIDLEDRDPETGNAANVVLQNVIDRIEIQPDRSAKVILRPGVDAWVHHT